VSASTASRSRARACTGTMLDSPAIERRAVRELRCKSGTVPPL